MSRPYDPKKGFTSVKEYESHLYPNPRTSHFKNSKNHCPRCSGSVKVLGSSPMVIGDKRYTSYFFQCKSCSFSPVYYETGNGRQYRPQKKIDGGRTLRGWKRLMSAGYHKYASAMAKAALKIEIRAYEESS